MTDDQFDRPTAWWIRILKVIPWLIGAAILIRIAVLFGPARPYGGIQIGAQTTYVTKPRGADGFVDFAAAINQRNAEGVTPENNAVVKLMEAFGPELIAAEHRQRYFGLLGIAPLPEQGAYLVDDQQFLRIDGQSDNVAPDASLQFGDDLMIGFETPWSDEDYPQLARFLAANEEPLSRILEASQRTRYYSPIAEPNAELLSSLQSVEQQCRWASRLLTLRAMNRLERGDVEGAWDDLLACHRLARLLGQSPRSFIGALMSFALDRSACNAEHAVIASSALTAAQARKCLSDLDSLPPIASSVDAADFGERLTMIDTYCRMANGTSTGATVGRPAPGMTTTLGNAFDWNLMLTLANEHVDRNIEIMQLSDAQEREVELDRLSAKLRSRGLTWKGAAGAIIGMRRPISRDFSAVMAVLLSPAYQQVRSAEMATNADIRLSRLGFALAAYRLENGSYPDSLAALELAPGFLPEMPLDPCSGSEFVYESTDAGFILYSVGRNLIDDGGRGHDDEPRGDDIVLRVGVE